MIAVAPHWERTGLRVASHLPPSAPWAALGPPARAKRLVSPGPPCSLCGPHHPPPPRAGSRPCQLVPRLTQTRRAGMGVQRLTWIMASRPGRCPSRAPEKHSLGQRWGREREPGLGCPANQLPDLSSRPDVPLELSPPAPAFSGPQEPHRALLPRLVPPPFCFLYLLSLGSSLSQLQVGPTGRDLTSSGPWR